VIHEGVRSRIRDHVPLRKCRFVENKTRWPPSVGVPSSTLINGHAPCLSGRRPSSAVHHFGDHIKTAVKQRTIHKVASTDAKDLRSVGVVLGVVNSWPFPDWPRSRGTRTNYAIRKGVR
jgi:hypothetical protein